MSKDKPIRIHDTAFMTMSLIERCPNGMMVRELTKNALEAASQVEGGGKVSFRLVDVNGTRKLAIRNDGPGMDADALLAMCDLASSGKGLALDGNFGMGAKVASLGSNRAGLRYRSCRDGAVSQVTLGHDGDCYSVWSMDLGGGKATNVIDVTQAVLEEGGTVDADWTEVTLFGSREDQDTMLDPFDGKPEVHKQWIGTHLIQRFDGLPENVVVTLEKGTNPRDGKRRFHPFHEMVEKYGGQVEVVTDPETGIGIRYLFDEVRDGKRHLSSVHNSLTTARVGAGVVHRQEIYEVLDGHAWAGASPRYGVTYGSRQLSVNVLLPDDFPVRPEQYRRFLEYTGPYDGQGQLSLEDFRDMVVSRMPAWFRDKVASFRPLSAGDDGDLRKKMQDWMDQRRTRRPRPADGEATCGEDAQGALVRRASPSRDDGPDLHDEEESTHQRRRREPRPASNLRTVPNGAVAASLRIDQGLAPRIEKIVDPKDVDEKRMTGMAGRYDLSANVILVNMNYSAFGDARADFELEYASSPVEPELRSSVIREHAEEMVILKVGFAVAYALVKHGTENWPRESVETATTPESLSVAADGWEREAGEVRRKLGKILRKSRLSLVASEEDVDEAA